MPRDKDANLGTVVHLCGLLWRALEETQAVSEARSCLPAMVLKVAHAFSQLTSVYLTAVESTELDPRVAALEARNRVSCPARAKFYAKACDLSSTAANGRSKW